MAIGKHRREIRLGNRRPRPKSDLAHELWPVLKVKLDSAVGKPESESPSIAGLIGRCARSQ